MNFAYFFCSLRCYYNLIVKAAGHYKQTQKGAIIEALLNIVISVIVVWKFGLIGVAVGTLIAMSYRTIYFVVYLKNNIIYRDLKYFYKHLAIDGIYFLILKITTNWIKLSSISYGDWIIMAIKVFVIAVFELLILNFLFYRKEIKSVVHSVWGRS